MARRPRSASGVWPAHALFAAVIGVFGLTYAQGASWLSANDLDFSKIDDALVHAIDTRVFPGCVAGVATADGEILYLKAFGSLMYPGDTLPLRGTMSAMESPVDTSTRFDIASLTKVTATTTAAALLVQQGLLRLDQAVSDTQLLGADFAVNGKASVTIRNLLLHNSGFPPDPQPNYWQGTCPSPAGENQPPKFDCFPAIYDRVLNQTLQNPVGVKYVYSDLSMITLAFVVGKVAMDAKLVVPEDLRGDCNVRWDSTAPGLSYLCTYEAYVRTHVFGAMNMSSTGFLPHAAKWAQTAPTWVDTEYRFDRTLQGVVSDGNAYAQGGVAGHAGVFATAGDLLTLVSPILRAAVEAAASGSPSSIVAPNELLSPATAQLFTTVGDPAISRRALGWDTHDSKCGTLSEATFTHTGYTGTQICADPTRQVVTVLLTNRCYPSKTANFAGVAAARRAMNTAVASTIDECISLCGGVCPCPPPTPEVPREEPKHRTKHFGLRLAAIIVVLVVLSFAIYMSNKEQCHKSWNQRVASKSTFHSRLEEDDETQQRL